MMRFQVADRAKRQDVGHVWRLLKRWFGTTLLSTTERSLSKISLKTNGAEEGRTHETGSWKVGPSAGLSSHLSRRKSSVNSSPGSLHISPKVEQHALATFSEEDVQSAEELANTESAAAAAATSQPASQPTHSHLLGNDSSDSLHSLSDAAAESPRLRPEQPAADTSTVNGRSRANSLGAARNFAQASSGTATPQANSARSSMIAPSNTRSTSRLPFSRVLERANSSDSDDELPSIGLRRSLILRQSRRGSGVGSRRNYSRVRRGPGLALAASNASSKQGSPRPSVVEFMEGNNLVNDSESLGLLSDNLKARLMATLQDYADEVMNGL
jgi:hypothetical protein